MKKLLIVLFALLMCLTGCSKEKEESSAIKIGGSGPLTGDAAVYGIDVKNAAELAVNEINALEGKEFFSFKMEDDEADGEKAINAFGKLLDWGMQISLYTVTSGAGLAVAQDYNEQRIFALTPSGSNPGLVYSDEKNYDNLFQVCFSDPNQGSASAEYIYQNSLASKIAVIYRNDDDYSISIYETFMKRAAELGLEVVSVTSFSKDEVSFSTQLQDAKSKNADLVFLPIYYQPASSILTEANKMNYEARFFGVDGMDGILGVEGFNTSLAEGVFLLTPFAADAQDEATVNFVKNFKEKYGSVPTQFAADTYDAVYAIYQACKNANITSNMKTSDICDALIAQFTKMTYEGLTGTATWSTKGEVSKSPKAVVIKNGQYVAID